MPCNSLVLRGPPAPQRLARPVRFSTRRKSNRRHTRRQEGFMRLDARWFRGTLIVLGVAIAAASLVSPAAADHGRRYKGPGGNPGGYPGGYGGGYGGVRVVRHGTIFQGRSYTTLSRSSCGTPALAGFIGGLIVGNVLAHAAPPPQ